MIEVSDEMLGAWHNAFNRAAEEAVKDSKPYGTGDIARAALAAVLAIVERDYDVRPKGSVHLILPGLGVTACCKRTPFELPGFDRITTDMHAATCPQRPSVTPPGDTLRGPGRARS